MDYDFLLDGDPSPPTPTPQKSPNVTRAHGDRTAAKQYHSAPINKLLRIRDVLDMVRVSRPTIYRLIAKGDFPKPVMIGSARLWPENEINKWLIDRMNDRDR